MTAVWPVLSRAGMASPRSRSVSLARRTALAASRARSRGYGRAEDLMMDSTGISGVLAPISSDPAAGRKTVAPRAFLLRLTR